MLRQLQLFKIKIGKSVLASEPVAIVVPENLVACDKYELKEIKGQQAFLIEGALARGPATRHEVTQKMTKKLTLCSS